MPTSTPPSNPAPSVQPADPASASADPWALWPADGPADGVVVDLGRMEYQAAWTVQRERVAARRAGTVPDTLLLVEHPPTITLGRGGSRDHLLANPAELAPLGIVVHEVDRGGDITYHGPGQLVAYPIVDLLARGRNVHGYLRLLEEATIRALADLGQLADRRPPHTGVWVGEQKIAAIGVRVSRGVTLHGLALNVAPNLAHFATIVPCGLHGLGVTSLAALQGASAPAWEQAAAVLARRLGELLGVRW